MLNIFPIPSETSVFFNNIKIYKADPGTMHCTPPSIWQFLWVCFCKFYCLTRIYMYFYDISLHDMFTIFDFLSILLTKTKGMWEKASKQYIDYKNFTHPASARLEFFDPPQDIDISFFQRRARDAGTFDWKLRQSTV